MAPHLDRQRLRRGGTVWRHARARRRIPAIGGVILVAVMALFLAPAAGAQRHRAASVTELQFWNPASAPVAKKAIAALVDAFNRTHPTIHVVDDSVSTADSYAKYTTALTTGSGPDVIMTYDYYPVALWAADGLIQPLNPLVKRYGLQLPNYFGSALDAFSWKGQFYGLPQELDDTLLAWNKTMFKKAGLNPNEPPRTIAQLSADAKRLTHISGGKVTQLGLNLDASDQGFNFSTWAYAFGGRFYDARTQTPTMDNPGVVAAYSWMQKLLGQMGGIAQTEALISASSVGDSFQSGTAAMELVEENFPHYATIDGPKDPYGLAPIPTAPGVPYGTTFVQPGNAFVIPKHAQNLAATMTFLKYASATPGILNWCVPENNLPPWKGLAFSSEFAQKAPTAAPFVAVMHHAVGDGLFGTPVTTYFQIQRDDTANAIFYKGENVKTAAKALDAQVLSYQKSFVATHHGDPFTP